jgi:hypothetical protein
MMKSEDLINFGALSEMLTGRKDVIRKNRVQKKYSKRVEELKVLIQYWVDMKSKEV